MKIKMLTMMAGPKGVISPGAVVDVPEAEGELLIKGGYALSAEPPAPPPKPAAAAKRSTPRRTATKKADEDTSL